MSEASSLCTPISHETVSDSPREQSPRGSRTLLSPFEADSKEAHAFRDALSFLFAMMVSYDELLAFCSSQANGRRQSSLIPPM